MFLTEPKVLNPPGLREIKQVELFTKFRPLIPEEFREELCPRPPDNVLAKISSDRREKGRKRRADNREATRSARQATTSTAAQPHAEVMDTTGAEGNSEL